MKGIFNLEIVIYIIVGIISFGLSYILAGLVDKFTKEDAIIQEYLSQHDQNDKTNDSLEAKKKFKEFKKRC